MVTSIPMMAPVWVPGGAVYGLIVGFVLGAISAARTERHSRATTKMRLDDKIET
jgi:hypothetical protein